MIRGIIFGWANIVFKKKNFEMADFHRKWISNTIFRNQRIFHFYKFIFGSNTFYSLCNFMTFHLHFAQCTCKSILNLFLCITQIFSNVITYRNLFEYIQTCIVQVHQEKNNNCVSTVADHLFLYNSFRWFFHLIFLSCQTKAFVTLKMGELKLSLNDLN